MSALKTWYSGLQERERNMVIALGVALAILLIFLLVVLPLKNYFNSLNDDLSYYENQAITIEKQVAAIKSAGPGKVTNDNISLNQLVNQTAKSFGLSFSRIEERERNKEIQLRLDNVEFDQLLRWISLLEQGRGLVVDTLRVSKKDAVGRVDASIKLIKAS
ncbi:type II secretion system protein GspM [Kangiella aquimarina]|uniref:Type II secretion system protein M n=1 Tax=Kangiella aquimarina TaxID=261965 RepID=A0ABZ0X5R6_9GAMM|nr:type II secretion system protein GspM [Kangiella aquimarina]WQG85943.1 type II secretion system protein GspM [Kangiella aquimarina]